MHGLLKGFPLLCSGFAVYIYIYMRICISPAKITKAEVEKTLTSKPPQGGVFLNHPTRYTANLTLRLTINNQKKTPKNTTPSKHSVYGRNPAPGMYRTLQTMRYAGKPEFVHQHPSTVSSLWLQPIWKVKLDHFSRLRGENKRYLSCHHLLGCREGSQDQWWSDQWVLIPN